MKNIKNIPHYKKLKSVIPEDRLVGMIERDIMPYLDDFDKWKSESNIQECHLADVFPDRSIESNQIRLEDFLGRWGNLSIEALCKLCLIIRGIKPKNVFEIGTYNGTTTLQIAQNLSDVEHMIYTLDLPDNYTGHGMSEIDTYMFQTTLPNIERKFNKTIYKKTIKPSIQQLIGDSRTFDFSPYYGKINLVFIDGAHDYDTKKSDTENALKMLADHGVIIWDNYNDVGCPFTTKYLSELSHELKIYNLKNTQLAVYRK